MAVNLIIAELTVTAIAVPFSAYLAINHLSLLPLVFLLPVPILLPLLMYWHSKALWMASEFLLHPAPLR
jgi:hypothetical protein